MVYLAVGVLNLDDVTVIFFLKNAFSILLNVFGQTRENISKQIFNLDLFGFAMILNF